MDILQCYKGSEARSKSLEPVVTAKRIDVFDRVAVRIAFLLMLYV